MAAFTAIIAAAGLGLSAVQYGAARKREGEASRAADAAAASLKQTIEKGVPNVMEGLQVPTKGIELQEAAMARAIGGGVEAAKEAGAAGVIGGVGRITQAAGEQSAQQAARIEQAQFERDKLVLGQEQKLELLKYQGLTGLEQAQLSGAGQASADAYAAQQAALSSGVESLTALGVASYGDNPYGDELPTKKESGILSRGEWKEKTSASPYGQGTYQEYLKSVGYKQY